MADAPKVRIAPPEPTNDNEATARVAVRPQHGVRMSAAMDDGSHAAGEGTRGEAPSSTEAMTNVVVTTWLTQHFPGHEHMVVGAVCGLVIALLVFAIGLLRTLLVVVLVGGGAAIGQFFDGDARIISLIRQIVSERRG